MATLICGYILTVLLAIGVPRARKDEPGVRQIDIARTRRTSAVLGVTHLLALLIPLGAALKHWRPQLGAAGGWLAVGVMAAALLFQRWAQRSLGPSFTTSLQSSKEQPILRTGPYRWVRHPAYLAQTIFWTALGFSSRSLIAGLAVGLISLSGYVYRLLEEEKMLLETHGDVYSVYASSTKRLIPLLW